MRVENKLPPIGQPFVSGETVWITCQGRTVAGLVSIASANGRSLILELNSMLAGCIGVLVVMQRDDGTFHSLFGENEIIIKRRCETVH